METLIGNKCCADSGSCDELGQVRRRRFIQAGGLAASMLLAGRSPVMAGPFVESDFDQIIPADKKLSKEWIASLYSRGNPLTATGDDLKFIGMPINGLCTGQVYLGGDGQLWHWNLDASRDYKNNTAKGPRFMAPEVAGNQIGQGFALQVGPGESGQVFTLNAKGFRDVTFTNHYPMATVDYRDSKCPVVVHLQAYTPFIPLNRDDSSYPVIVMQYTIKNTSASQQAIAIAGWIENISNAKSGKSAKGIRRCEYHELDGISTVECSADFQSHLSSQVELSTQPPSANNSRQKAGFETKPDSGSIALGLMGDAKPEIVDIQRSLPGVTDLFALNQSELEHGSVSKRDFKECGVASLGRRLTLAPGETQTISFTLSWRFPNVRYSKVFGKKTVPAINHYATQWPTATDSAGSVASRESELHDATQMWVDTWYDSTLPYWFLERTFITLDCVQTQMGQRFAEGTEPEHYNFDEGVKCCPGNCTHVWHYAQGLARIFPQIERENRDKIEYGMGFDLETGSMRHRYTDPKFVDAIDGQCGTILRVLRESQMSPDYQFLESIWDRTKLSMDHVIRKWDADEDGVLEGSQHNTLDEPWFGQVHWLINLYHAALKASALMARQMSQPAVAQRYEQIVAKGGPAMVDLLWNDDYGYFIHKPGPGDHQKHGSTNGCHIDQLLGDSWLWNVGIDRVLPQEKIRQSLDSLWKYNFAPDVGSFREKVAGGRWYAASGNAGLIMCSFPHGKIEPKSGKKSYAGYLNECMTGFEWQVAAHMIWEGMLEKGLAIGKAIYDRYLPQDRNPYNEVECSDHYSRAMASYGAYLAICGYRYDGPQGKLAFGPRLTPENFRAAFTTAQGWGRFSQELINGKQTASIELRYGKLDLKEFTLDPIRSTNASDASAKVDGTSIDVVYRSVDGRHVLSFGRGLNLVAGQRIEVQFV